MTFLSLLALTSGIGNESKGVSREEWWGLWSAREYTNTNSRIRSAGRTDKWGTAGVQELSDYHHIRTLWVSNRN